MQNVSEAAAQPKPRVLSKHELEATLYGENRDIRSGKLKDENPLDYSDEFVMLCEACRTGNLSLCQRWIQHGVNINASDNFQCTPLMLASLCGHYEVVRLLLESGALCERDTFQGERCLYNALNDKIRNLLLEYDYSKTRDPLQPYAAHLTSLLHTEISQMSDITLTTGEKNLQLHKFILAARSPYFAKKLAAVPETATWKVSQAIPSRSLEIAIESLYLGEVNPDLSASDDDQAILSGIEKLCSQLEIGSFLEKVLDHSDSAGLSAAEKRLAHRRRKQERTDEVERGRKQLTEWFETSVLANQIHTDSAKADNIKWDRENGIFADVLLCALEDENEDENDESGNDTDAANEKRTNSSKRNLMPNGIPVGPLATTSASASRDTSPSGSTAQRRHKVRPATVIPAHRAMLIRSEYFHAMFSSAFREAQPSAHLPIIHIDCSPAVLRVILTFLYTEDTSGITLDLAIDVLFAADLLFIEKLKTKAATIISTLGNGEVSVVEAANPHGNIAEEEEVIDIYDVIRAGWDTRVNRLEEFGARYIAYRLERYIDEPHFTEIVKESAARIQARQETDTIELIDDIRHYLSERFRLRMEDTGFDEFEEEMQPVGEATTAAKPDSAVDLLTHSNESAASNNTEGQAPTTAPTAPSKTDDDLASEQAIAGMAVMRTLDGEVAGDEFAQDAINYQILLGKIDALLDKLKIDA